MKTFKKYVFMAVAVAFIVCIPPIISACGGGSASASGSTGPTLAQFNALKQKVSDLSNTVQSMQGQLSGVSKVGNLKLVVSGTQGNSALRQSRTLASAAATATCGGWTITGRPTTSNPATSNLLSVSTCTGYTLTISESTAAGNGYIQPLSGHVAAVFTTPDCTGQMYLLNGDHNATFRNGFYGLSDGAAATGFVFTLNPAADSISGMDDSDYSNPAYYWYVPAESTPDATITVGSEWMSGGLACNTGASFQGMTLSVYTVMQNDSSVTDAPSAPKPGPNLPAGVQ